MGKRLLASLSGLMLLVAGTLHAKTVRLVYTDAQGTVVAKTDVQGTIIARYDYRPYGAPVSGGLPQGPGYTGHVNDPEAGLVYMQQRYYDPVVGRFISKDPIGPTPGNAFNSNVYVYANGNPILLTDPTGMCVGGADRRWDDPCNPDQVPERPPASKKPEVPPEVQRMRDTADRAGGTSIQASLASYQNSQSYWSRVEENFLDANKIIPGRVASPLAGVITSRALSNATSLPTITDAAIGSYRMGYITLEIAPAVAHSALNFIIVGGSFETGIFLGSMINAAHVPGSSETYREWYSNYLCDHSSSCR